jgi:hypothetical protein
MVALVALIPAAIILALQEVVLALAIWLRWAVV